MQQPSLADSQRSRCDEKGASPMTETHTDDVPGFVAEEPEQCHDCYRLIRHSSAYLLTLE
jgi:hypothetical protein